MHNTQVKKSEIWNGFKYQGRYYHIEIFHMADGTFQASAEKVNNRGRFIFEDEELVGSGWDPSVSIKAAIEAIRDLRYVTRTARLENKNRKEHDTDDVLKPNKTIIIMRTAKSSIL